MTVVLANEMVDRGYRVDIILLKSGGRFSDGLSEKVNVINFDLKYAWGGAPRLASYIRRERPDIVISSFDPTNVIAIVGWLFSLKSSKMMVRTHGHLSRYILDTSSRYQWMLPLLIRRLYPLVDFRVAVSDGVADDLAGFTGISRDSITTIYNPVVRDRFNTPPEEITSHAAKWKPDAKIILGVGRLSIDKNFALLIRAFASVRQRIPSARLVIVGEGSQRPVLEKMIADRGLTNHAELPGFINNPWPYYSTADVFVSTSNHEGFGNAIVEAMACGCPVVCTDCPSGPREILDDGEYGTLVPVDDVGALVTAILNALECTHDTTAAADRSAYFSVQKSTDNYLGMIFSKTS
ncbi:MAG: glycosyltransferase, partial [Rhodothermales bacterium]|nr:glycosyltransferase [Rhodothermales bacterium]